MREFARQIDTRDIAIRPIGETPAHQTMEALSLPLEVAGNPFSFKLVLGSIIKAQTDTILCPLGSEFKNDLGGTLAEAIEEQSGKKPFRNARRYTLKHAVDLSLEGEVYQGVPFGTVRAVSSGDLVQKGIRHIVFANTDALLHDPLNIEKIARIVGNALKETDRVKGKTLAVPMIGTGELAVVSELEAVAGTLAGIGVYREQVQQNPSTHRTVEGLSLVAYYSQTAESAETGKRMVLNAIHLLQSQ